MNRTTILFLLRMVIAMVLGFFAGFVGRYYGYHWTFISILGLAGFYLMIDFAIWYKKHKT